MAAAAADGKPLQRRRSITLLPPKMSQLRVVVLGNSWPERKAVFDLIRGTPETHDVSCISLPITRYSQDTQIHVFNTPDLPPPSASNDKFRKFVEDCVRLCEPGPHVFLLVLQPEDFPEEHQLTLCRVLQLFSDQSFNRSLILLLTPRGESLGINKWLVNGMVRKCGGRVLCQDDVGRYQLINQFIQIFEMNDGAHVTCHLLQDTNSSLNLVLCGRRGAGKTSAAKAILGQSEVDLSDYVKHQGEVCGLQVSLMQIPALYGKPLKAVMEESLRCISLYDPEGIHAFIVGLTVGALTDEDKGELETIQNTFGSQVNDFIMILFAVDSDITARSARDFIQKDTFIKRLLDSTRITPCVINRRKKSDITMMLSHVERRRSYTTETFEHAQREKITQLENHIKIQQAELHTLKKTITMYQQPKPECLRIVLIGKTGCGKSSSGNTILGRKAFHVDLNQKSVTKRCQKKQSDVDGRRVVVVDTPGLFDDSLSHDEINKEMVKCISLLAPGPHVFLLVINIGKFTQEEQETLKLIEKSFGKTSQNFTIILLTGGDALKSNNLSVKEFIEKKCTDSFKKLISDCGGRYHVFNNKEEENRSQVIELIDKVETMVMENGGKYYTNAMLQEAEGAIQKETERNMKRMTEEMRREKEELKRKHVEEIQAMEKRLEEQSKELTQNRKLRDKELEQYRTEFVKGNDEESRKNTGESARRCDWEVRGEDKLRQQEEQEKLQKLKEEYEQKREQYENQRKEEDRIRGELEAKERKELEAKYRSLMIRLQEIYEQRARKQAEELNEFQDKYVKKMQEHEEQMKAKDERYDLLQAFSAVNEENMKKHHRDEIVNLVKGLSKKREYIKKFSKLVKKHDKELLSKENPEETEALQKSQEQELNDLIQDLVSEVQETRACPIL